MEEDGGISLEHYSAAFARYFIALYYVCTSQTCILKLLLMYFTIFVLCIISILSSLHCCIQCAKNHRIKKKSFSLSRLVVYVTLRINFCPILGKRSKHFIKKK